MHYLLTALRLAAVSLALTVPALADQAGARLAEAIAATKAGQWDVAGAIAASAGNPEAATYIEWVRLRAGKGEFGDYQRFLAAHGDWPGLPLLVKAGESKIPKSADPQAVVAYFTGQPPQTGVGALRLGAALMALGAPEKAAEALLAGWVTLDLTEDEQAAFLERYGDMARKNAAARLDALLWRGATDQALRMLPLTGPKTTALARARIGLRGSDPGVDKLIAAVPAELAADPGLAYERFLWRIRKDHWDEAAELLLQVSTSAKALGRPEDWGNLRRSVARREMRLGHPKNAYAIASQHFLSEGEDYADLEWLSGWIALRKLNDPERALDHFQRFRAAVDSPISLGRAWYWIGRALEAAGDAEAARDAYAEGARWQTTFYGQLAAARAGLAPDATLAGRPVGANWRDDPVLRTGPVLAGILLHEAGEALLNQRFFAHAAETATPEGQAALAALALQLGRAHTAISVSKNAANLGVVLNTEFYYPLTDLASFADVISPELAMSIARQESELNPEVVSEAGARGLMQVMPDTARKVAGELGIQYQEASLTSDWRYNAKLGTAYLAGLLQRYGGSQVLAIAAYNAGPHRVDAWIADYGDPRASGVDTIDWIETIPFRETQNYVQRVLESLYVYHARISGQTGPLTLGKALGDDRL